ncbi:MAG: tRNA pseudouridine(55) synthase TruB [Vicinamibacterales bacterium]
MRGALLVDKPAGPTSHDIVAVVRRALRTQQVGHTGTLDPLATGLLVVLVGPATRLARFIAADEKEYLADVRLGIATPTYDAASLPAMIDGRGAMIDVPAAADIDAALAHFRGTFMQTPPPFSAKKIAGVPAHEHARNQRRVELRPVEVHVRELELLQPPASNLQPPTSSLQPPTSSLLRLRIAASAGFYVRSLAHDLGERLGCGAHLEALRRVRAGRFSISDALPLDTIVNDPETAARRMIPPGDLLDGLASARLTPKGVTRAAHGNRIGPEHLAERPQDTEPGRSVRLFDGDELVGVATVARDGGLQPVVVLAPVPEVKY